MRDTRLYSSAYYRDQVNNYLQQLQAVEPESEEYKRLRRYIAVTQQYLNDAEKAGL